MPRKCKSRIQWEKGDQLNKWVTCLNCDHEYFIESFELNPCCPVCESRAYDETGEEMEYINLEELEGLL